MNEADPYVMQMQIDAAADHGVNVFIYDWYWYDRRPFLEGCLNDGYLKAKNNDRVKFYLMWANHDASTLWDIRISDEGDWTVWLGSVDRREFEKICLRLIDRYFTHPSYYRIGGKPAFMFYDLDALIRGLGSVEQTREALDWFREKAVEAGLGGLHLQCTLRKHRGYNITGVAGDNVGVQQEVMEALGFDGLTHYQFCHFTDIDRDYGNIMEDVVKEWNEVEEAYTVPYFPHVSVGWDNNPRFKIFRPGIVTGNDPEKFEKALQDLQAKGTEITPEVLLDIPLQPVDRMEDYADVIAALAHHRKGRDRFCYIQTPGIFECLNGPFGIEDHLCHMALYPDELIRVYDRQAHWNARFAENTLELGIDMVHVSDDWGAQRSLLFSLDMWKDMIYPYHKIISGAVKARNGFLSLHSDGCILPALEGIVDIGYDVVHPWQESAGMRYDTYLEKYSDKFGILGGLCIQTTLGFGDYTRLESEIRRVFHLLKGKRWMFCTTHFVQDHCSLEELAFAYDLVVKLARE